MKQQAAAPANLGRRSICRLMRHMGGCQNYGPLLGPPYTPWFWDPSFMVLGSYETSGRAQKPGLELRPVQNDFASRWWKPRLLPVRAAVVPVARLIPYPLIRLPNFMSAKQGKPKNMTWYEPTGRDKPKPASTLSDHHDLPASVSNPAHTEGIQPRLR